MCGISDRITFAKASETEFDKDSTAAIACCSTCQVFGKNELMTAHIISSVGNSEETKAKMK